MKLKKIFLKRGFEFDQRNGTKTMRLNFLHYFSRTEAISFSNGLHLFIAQNKI